MKNILVRSTKYNYTIGYHQHLIDKSGLSVELLMILDNGPKIRLIDYR